MFGQSGSVTQLTDDQISTFLSNHWGFWLDYHLGTISPTGESVYDNTLGEYVFMWSDSDGNAQLVMSPQPFDNENIYSAMGDVAASSVQAIGSDISAAGNAALNTATQLPQILVFAGIAVGLYFLTRLSKRSV